MASLKELYRLQSTLTGEQIKSLYEGEFDTNTYTDAEKVKVGQTETTTQLNARDTANRSRTNHTGTQAISTVSGLQSALDSKEPADATILKDADIGTSVQPYDPDTVIDANYVQTEENYSTTEKNRLASIYYAPTNTKTANYTAVNKEEVLCDTSGGSFTVTLPASGSIRIIDTVGSHPDTGFGVHNLTILPAGGHTILGDSSFVLDVGGSKLALTLYGTDWKVTKLETPSYTYVEKPVYPVVVPLAPFGYEAEVLLGRALLGEYFPYNMTVSSVVLTLTSAPTGSSFIVDIKRNGNSIFTTLLSVDGGEKTSVTAAVPYVLIDNPMLMLGDLVTFDVVQIGATDPGVYPVLTILGE